MFSALTPQIGLTGLWHRLIPAVTLDHAAHLGGLAWGLASGEPQIQATLKDAKQKAKKVADDTLANLRK